MAAFDSDVHEKTCSTHTTQGRTPSNKRPRRRVLEEEEEEEQEDEVEADEPDEASKNEAPGI